MGTILKGYQVIFRPHRFSSNMRYFPMMVGHLDIQYFVMSFCSEQDKLPFLCDNLGMMHLTVRQIFDLRFLNIFGIYQNSKASLDILIIKKTYFFRF